MTAVDINGDDVALETTMKPYDELLAENLRLKSRVKDGKRLALGLLGVALISTGAVIAILINFISLDTLNCKQE